MTKRLLLLALLIPSATPAQTRGQSGQGCWISPSIECNAVVAREGELNAERQWVRAIVLARRPAPMPLNRDAEGIANDRYQRALSSAQARGLASIGTRNGGHYLVVSFTQRSRTRARTPVVDSLFVGGDGFFMPARDSVLVVLLDQMGSGIASPRVEAAMYFPTASLASYPDGQGTNVGDSTRAREACKAEAWLRELLQGTRVTQDYLESVRATDRLHPQRRYFCDRSPPTRMPFTAAHVAAPARVPLNARAQHTSHRELLDHPSSETILVCEVRPTPPAFQSASGQTNLISYAALPSGDANEPSELETNLRFYIVWDSAGRLLQMDGTHHWSPTDTLSGFFMLSAIEPISGTWVIGSRQSPMTPADISEARALATVLWTRRCIGAPY